MGGGAVPDVDPVRVLEASETLAPLTATQRRRLAAIAATRRYRAGQEIFGQDEPVRTLRIVAEGRVKMLRALPGGRSVVLALFDPGRLFGAVETLGGRPSRSGTAAQTDAVVLEIERDRLFALLDREPGLATALLVALTPHLAECTNCVVEMAALRVEARLARLLTALAGRGPAPRFVPVALSRQDLADMTGTTIETCIRVMSRWGKEGLVETRDDGFVLHDPDRLRALSGAP